MFEFIRGQSPEQAIEQGVKLATGLTDARSNQLTPELFAETALRLTSGTDLRVRIRQADELRDQGFGGITAIGAGSARQPVLLELWLGPSETEPPSGALAFAGKGVTFDSGGLSLKSPTAMYSMHTDCAAAAAVFAGMLTLADTDYDSPLYAVLPLVENIPGPTSARPGDVVRMRNGTGVEIVDTDFEGRVILADALSLICESQPQSVVSFATLTYQSIVALGQEIGALLGRDEDLGSLVLEAAESAGEAMWALPWATRYEGHLKSIAPGAQLRNHPLNDTGRAITAALFLGQFVSQGIPYAHVDMAGPALRSTPDGPLATGYGVRTVVEVARAWSQLQRA